MKLYYFNVFARAEPIRMMLSYAKVPFEDCRIGFDAMNAMKAEGSLEYGQLPMLELDDGTKLCQSAAIYNYVSTVYGLNPESPLAVHRGHSLYEAIMVDFVYK